MEYINTKILHVEHTSVWSWKLDTSESRSEMLEKFWIVVLDRNWEDHLDRSCEKWNDTKSRRGISYI